MYKLLQNVKPQRDKPAFKTRIKNRYITIWKDKLSNQVLHILIYIQQDAKLHSLFHLETVLHVSGGITHHQERKQLYLQYMVFVTPLLLTAAIAEELELAWVCCGWRTRNM